MKIFGIEYKTRKELLEENERLKAENRMMFDKKEESLKYESCYVQKCYAQLIVPYREELYLPYQKIKDDLCEELFKMISEVVNYEREVDITGDTVHSASVYVLRK